jgi:hypothetical protein
MAVRPGGESWERGWAGEQDVRRWLKERGFYVIPTADIANGGAPVLEGLAYKAVLPDLMLALQGHSRWADVKTKSVASKHRQTRIWEHGCQTAHYADYLACQEQTGIEGWLAVYELRPIPMVLLQRLDELRRYARFYEGPNMPDGKPHVFFPRDRFDWYEGPHQDIALAKPAEPKAPRTLTQGAPPSSRQLDLFRDPPERRWWR